MMIRTLRALDLDVTLCALNQSFRDRRSDATAAELAEHYGLRGVTVRKHPKFQRKISLAYRAHRIVRFLEKISGIGLRLSNEDNCPASFRRAVRQACEGKQFDFVWVNYAKLLPAVPSRLRSRAVIDTNDIQTTLFEAEGLRRYPRMFRPLARRLFWRSEVRLLRRAPVIVSINPRESEVLRTVCPDSRVVTLPAIVDADRARPDRAGEAVDLLFVGSASHANVEGLVYFLGHVFTKVIEARPSTTLLIVGRVGTAAAVANHAVVRRHQDTLIHREDHVDDVASAYRRGRIVVAPILSGAGMKIKVVEAFAHGKCVVGTRLAFDGIRAEHEKNAFISDDAQAMAEAIRILLGEPERRMWVEREARRLFERDHSMAVAVRTLRSELRL